MSDGGLHRIDVLAAVLRVPVLEVVRSIEALQQAGAGLEYDPGRATARWGEPFVPLDAVAIARAAGGAHAEAPVHVVESCPSTNDLLRDAARDGVIEGTALLCEWQTAGRGRHGRSWVTSIGGALALSILWRFSRGPRQMAGLSLAVAVAAARALDRGGIRDIALKWPNDLLCAGRKVGGILVETSLDASGECRAVIGIGVNVQLRAADLRAIAISRASERNPSIDLPAPGDLTGSMQGPHDRNALAGAIVGEVRSACRVFDDHGFSAFRAAWLARHAHREAAVVVRVDGRDPLAGIAIGVADDGALILETEAGRQHVYAGEVAVSG